MKKKEKLTLTPLNFSQIAMLTRTYEKVQTNSRELWQFQVSRNRRIFSEQYYC